MREVLISIKPKWCELIASGKKTIEVRKTKPKLETPFKCYIYCTKAKNYFSCHGGIIEASDTLYKLPMGVIKCDSPFELQVDYEGQYDKNNFLNGKVIGEFVCDYIGYVRNYGDMVDSYDCIASCLSAKEIIEYAKDKNGNFVYTYGWHISNLVIYDKPRELSEFRKECKLECDMRSLNEPPCEKCEHLVASFGCGRTITRPPQSWCYVESESDTE